MYPGKTWNFTNFSCGGWELWFYAKSRQDGVFEHSKRSWHPLFLVLLFWSQLLILSKQGSEAGSKGGCCYIRKEDRGAFWSCSKSVYLKINGDKRRDTCVEHTTQLNRGILPQFVALIASVCVDLASCAARWCHCDIFLCNHSEIPAGVRTTLNILHLYIPESPADSFWYRTQCLRSCRDQGKRAVLPDASSSVGFDSHRLRQSGLFPNGSTTSALSEFVSDILAFLSTINATLRLVPICRKARATRKLSAPTR